MEKSAWYEKAKCSKRTDLFYTKTGERPEARAKREAEAKKLCDECPVIKHCLRFAIENQLHGFVGGTSEEQRAAMGVDIAHPSNLAVERAAKRFQAGKR